MHNFKKLKVYTRALGLTNDGRRITDGLPNEELFGLTSQFRRASYSIVLNIAEGAGSNTSKEFSRFLQIALRSCYECLGCIDIARVNRLLDVQRVEPIETEIKEIISMIVGLRRSLKK